MVGPAPGETDDTRDDLCTGRGAADGDHCCWVANEVCRFLTISEQQGQRRFECSLRRDLGSWEAVHAHPGYQEHVQPVWDQIEGIDSCGSWQPSPGECCRQER